MRMVSACRKRLGKEVELCVIPQRQRLLAFLDATGRMRPTICVWNCPRLSEILKNDAQQDSGLTLYYHGSINKERVPAEMIIAASGFNGAVRVRIAGYESPGSIGYIQELTKLAQKNGAPGLIEYLGTIPLRKDLLRRASHAHVGLSFMPKSSDDINLQHMVGASNKPFDCMACGLPLLVTDSPEWIATFVKEGYARACNPADIESIRTELHWYLDHPKERREMGRRCADRIRNDWNYEAEFCKVLEALEGE
jgi:glycosyltransferase involved in cell wall biosynthesis